MSIRELNDLIDRWFQLLEMTDQTDSSPDISKKAEENQLEAEKIRQRARQVGRRALAIEQNPKNQAALQALLACIAMPEDND